MKHKKLHTDGKGRRQAQGQQVESAAFAQSIQLSIELDNLEK